MNGYLELSGQYLHAHKKRTWLSMFSIVLSVALVVGIFSMLDVFLRFEKIQVIHDYGNYHILVKNASQTEKDAITGRIDVNDTGTFFSFQDSNVNGDACSIIALSENFAPNMGITMLAGAYPEAENELILESWAAEKLKLVIGDFVELSVAGHPEKTFVITGIFSDFGETKAAGDIGILISVKAAEQTEAVKSDLFLIQFKDRVNIKKAEAQIQEKLNIPQERIGKNEHLLAVIGQSDYKAAVGLYQTGAILFCIVLAAGVVMIYNTFHISVLERMRSFGLLRCVGASKGQVRRLVRREGLLLLRWSIPLGILLGMAATLFCSALLKFYNSYLFSEIPLFTLSPVGILAGIVIGVLTVVIATSLPARKAARVSPVCAVTGNADVTIKKTRKSGVLTKILPVETAMGVGNATVRKKTLILMSASIAISIAMFLGFNVLVGFLHTSLKTTKPYTPDVSLTCEEGFNTQFYEQISQLPGVKTAYGRMFGYVNASFDASLLTQEYRKIAGNITVNPDGTFVPPEQSWLISYDNNQLSWAKADLVAGELSEDRLNEENGIIAVSQSARKGVVVRSAELDVGDSVYLETVTGKKLFTVMAVLRAVPFNDDKLNLTNFVTTEKQFSEITGDHTRKVIDVQLKSKNQSETVEILKKLSGDGIDFLDSRQRNSEINQTFFTMAVFIYGFVAVIALISIFNIVSTMNTSVTSKMKYLGVLRAVGMSGKQLNNMVAAEATTYCAVGTAAGCILGVLLQKALSTQLLTETKMVWSFPLTQIIGVILAAFL
ncbi:MAG: ABC transporter permease, partial [Kiritimatiellales bacterium]